MKMSVAEKNLLLILMWKFMTQLTKRVRIFHVNENGMNGN